MINYDTKSWWKLIFKFQGGDTFRTLLPNISIVFIFSIAVVYIDTVLMPGHLKYTAMVHNLFGFVISLILVFRTNTAYDRWWEGRKLWGSLVNASRNLALKLNSYCDGDRDIRERIAYDIFNFSIVLKNHLRGNIYRSSFELTHPPSYAVNLLIRDILALNKRGSITEVQLLTLNDEITALSDICGSCERIKNTPIPFSYHVFIKKFVFAYIVSMPFVFAPEFGYWTALISSFMFYTLASLETLAEEVENPFGGDINDLPLDALTTLIQENVCEILIIYPDKD